MANYHENLSTQEVLKLRKLQKQLPSFLRSFFNSVSSKSSSRTATAYAYDLIVFFRYIFEEHKDLGGTNTKDLELSDLEKISAEDIEDFLNYLSFYVKNNSKNPEKSPEVTNADKGKARKLSAIRTMYKYYYSHERISKNPTTLVDSPKLHNKAIVRLNNNEVGHLLDAVESGSKLTKTQKSRHQQNQKRDLAIMTLLLGTGLRISECIGINLNDLNFNENNVLVTRKGGDTAFVYFSDEVAIALWEYFELRQKLPTKDKEETALFLSNQGRRMSPRTIQLLVKKYAQGVTSKKITPHKLRSTFGTNLYNETRDIYLVASVLGHSDVAVTQKFYVAMEEQNKQNAVNCVKLRKNQP